MVAASALGSSAFAQTSPNLFPELAGPPPPPGMPTMQEAIDAYLRARVTEQAPAANAPPLPPPPGRTLPPIKTIGPVPDPSHIHFTLPDDIAWTGRVGVNQIYNIFGDPVKPGPYLQLMKWWPGAYSEPHMHPNTRNVLVVSGTWWVSTSAVQDKTQTYPMPAGTMVSEPGNTYHWDGARNEPAILLLWGNGPSPNIAVDANGLPKPRAAAPR
jgi:quercetin dioxygenase-like cupin family protein